MTIATFAVNVDDASDTILVEVDEPGGPRRIAAGPDGFLQATNTLEQAVAAIRPVAGAVLAAAREHGPDAVEVELGFKLTADAGVVLVKAGSEAHLKIKLCWKPPAG